MEEISESHKFIPHPRLPSAMGFWSSHAQDDSWAAANLPYADLKPHPSASDPHTSVSLLVVNSLMGSLAFPPNWPQDKLCPSVLLELRSPQHCLALLCSWFLDCTMVLAVLILALALTERLSAIKPCKTPGHTCWHLHKGPCCSGTVMVFLAPKPRLHGLWC